MAKERPQTSLRKEREAVMAQLRGLLDEVPGAATPWNEIEEAFRRVPIRALKGLQYRVLMARTQSFGEGVEQEKRSREA